MEPNFYDTIPIFKSKILNWAKKGSMKLLIEKNLDLYPGDSLLLSAESIHYYGHDELADVVSYNPQDGFVYLKRPL